MWSLCVELDELFEKRGLKSLEQIFRGAVSAQNNGYYGVPLGDLTRLHHGLSGTVYAVDARTLHIRDFHYDGEGPAAYFYAGNSKAPSGQGFRIRDERGSAAPLRRYRGKHITITLPEGKTLHQIRWFAVWCEEFSVNFGDVRLNKNQDFPKPNKIGALRGIHGVSSDQVVVVDAQTLLVPSFSYDGEAPDAKFWVGRGAKPSPQGIRVPDENGKEVPLRRYEQKTLVLTLPNELTVFDIGHFGVWCEAFAVDFGHVQIPRGLNVPPSLRMLGVQPQKHSRSLQSHPDPSQGLSSPPESVLSLFSAAQTVRPTTYRPHTQRRQPTALGLHSAPEAAVQILPSIPLLSFDQRSPSPFPGPDAPQFQQQRPFPSSQPQTQPPPQAFPVQFAHQGLSEQQLVQQGRPHRLQQLHELSVQQHRLRQLQERQDPRQDPRQNHDLKIQALQQSHQLQIQEQQRQLEHHGQRLRELQLNDFQEQQRLRQQQQYQQRQQQQQPYQQQQQQQQRDPLRQNVPLRLPGNSVFQGLQIQSIQQSQGIELTSPQQTQNFLSGLRNHQGRPVQATQPSTPLERISPPPEQLLFKDTARDLYAINNLADSAVDGNNLDRGGRSDSRFNSFLPQQPAARLIPRQQQLIPFSQQTQQRAQFQQQTPFQQPLQPFQLQQQQPLPHQVFQHQQSFRRLARAL